MHGFGFDPRYVAVSDSVTGVGYLDSDSTDLGTTKNKHPVAVQIKQTLENQESHGSN